MKFAAAVFLFCLGLIPAMGQGALGKLPRVSVNGQVYVPLQEWGRANNFELRWLGKEDLQLGGQSNKVHFTVNSQKAEINGVGISLSLPVAARNGAGYIALLDLQTAVHPILFPRKGTGSVRVVCLDPGHGGKDPGNLDGKNQEKKYTLLLAQEVASMLKEAGIRTIFTRSSDRFIELPSRPEVANRNRADLFLSLHFNSAPVKSVSGIEVYCLTPAGASSTNARGEGASARNFPGNAQNEKNVLLAYELQRSLLRRLSAEDRGVHRARFSVLRDARMPAVLVEGGFMTHAAEGRKLATASYRQEMARAIVLGVEGYRRIVEQ